MSAASLPAARRLGWLGAGLIALGAGLAALALLGPLAFEVVEYPVGETLRNQTIGLDAFSLAVVAPLSAVAGVLALRGRAVGAALGLGVGAYASYMLAQYVVGPDYEGRPGDSARLFPLLVALFALGWAVALAAWSALAAAGLPRLARRPRRIALVALPLLALLVFARYLPALADAMSAAPEEPGYLAGPTFFWTIALLDLGVFLPATAAACVGLARGSRRGQAALYAVVGWFALVGPAVASMALAMYLNDDPTASGGQTAFLVAVGIVFVVLAVVVYRPLLRSRPAPGAPRRARGGRARPGSRAGASA